MSATHYGVFLRPDPLTCRAVHELTDLARHQFGIVSAGAFPPHATLVGSVPSDAASDEIVAALDPVFAGRPAITVHNAGIARLRFGLVFDVDRTADGARNEAIRSLAIDAAAALDAVRQEYHGRLISAFDSDRFSAHLSLASHDLAARPDLFAEVEQFLRAQPHSAPSEFIAEWVSLFQFHSADWSAEWWRDLTWEHVRSWRLG